VWGISAAILIETVAIHLLLVRRIPWLAWTLTALSVYAVVWLVRDYLAMGSHALSVDGESIQLKVGRRFDLSITRSQIARVIQPTFRDLPTPGTNQGRDFLNLTKPGAPNVLITLREPVRVRLPGGMHRQVQRLALHLDDAAAFVATLSAP
jgi:hypothetical protein